MILLDTHAIIWLATGKPRAKALLKTRQPLAVSPASLLELRYLEEIGRLQRTKHPIGDDPRWVIDEPPAGEWFDTAVNVTWTRDVFDRLLAAHALCRNMRLATGDGVLLSHLPEKAVFEL